MCSPKLNINRLLVVVVLFALVSCGGNDPYLYDRTGFDQNSRPVVSANPNAPNSVAPDYYRQQQQHYQQPYQQQYNPYQPQQVYQQPVYTQQVPAYQQQYPVSGGSRYYSNPYAIPPAGSYYTPRYDVDQYYSPPTNYNNVEPANQGYGVDRNSVGSTNY